MIDSKGKILIKPEMDKILNEYSGYTLYKGKLKGLYDIHKFRKPIPPMYIEFEVREDGYTSAKKENKLWDFYRNGELLIENMDSKTEEIILNGSLFRV